MIVFGLKISQAKKMFFDRQVVIAAVDKPTIRNLSKAGAFIRQKARSLIRKRKRTSRPGEPPSSHTGLLRKWILFGYDRDARSVVIGPTRLNSRSEGDAPRILEYGGSEMLRDRRGVKREVHYQARPYMGPSLTQSLPELPPLWRNSVKA